MDCVFCKIAKKEIPSDIVYEEGDFIAFKDVKPKAPVHILIIPKEHILTIRHLDPERGTLIGSLFLCAKQIAKEQGVSESGYRLIINAGENAGQSVDHLHLHLLGGKQLPWP